MMLIDLTPMQKKLRGLAREIAERFVRDRAAETDRSEAYPWDNVRELTKAGLMGYTIPKELGGAGGGSVSFRAKMPCQYEMLWFFLLMHSTSGITTWKWREF